MSNEIKLVIFDLDGTLIDAYTAIHKSFNYVMQKSGLKPQSQNTVRRLVGWGDLNLLKPYFSPKDLPGSLRLYRKHHQGSLLKYSRLYPYVRGILRQLREQGYKLAVASNRPSRFSRILLKHLQIRGFFDYVLCADQAAHPKPHPEMLNRIIRKFKLKNRQVLYVGDMAIDAQAGRAAKVKTVIVAGGSSSQAQIRREKPSKVIPAIRCLRSLFRGVYPTLNKAVGTPGQG